MRFLIKSLDPQSEYQARLESVDATSPHSFRCSHPRGAAHCDWLIRCAACPFAEVMEFDAAA